MSTWHSLCGGQKTTCWSWFSSPTMWVQGPDSAHKAWQQHLYQLSRLPSPQTNFTYQVSSSKNTDWQQEVKNSKNSDAQKSKDKKKNSPEPFILRCCVSETQCLMVLTNEWLKAALPSVRHCLLLLKSNNTDQRAILTLHPVSLGWQSSLHCC